MDLLQLPQCLVTLCIHRSSKERFKDIKSHDKTLINTYGSMHWKFLIWDWVFLINVNFVLKYVNLRVHIVSIILNSCRHSAKDCTCVRWKGYGYIFIYDVYFLYVKILVLYKTHKEYDKLHIQEYYAIQYANKGW